MFKMGNTFANLAVNANKYNKATKIGKFSQCENFYKILNNLCVNWG